MNADERYARCNTIQELAKVYKFDKLSANSWEYLKACQMAWAKHYRRLKETEEDET